ncbi:hypothetical protein [Methanobrevibacter sp.]
MTEKQPCEFRYTEDGKDYCQNKQGIDLNLDCEYCSEEGNE